MAWKAASLGSKFLFLLIIVPHLPSGVYARYLFLQTACLILAKLCTCGVEDHLPVVIRGNARVAASHSKPYFLGLTAAVIASALNLTFPNTVLAGIGLTLILATNNFLAGLIRTISASTYELQTNLHPIAFFVLALLVRPDSYIGLLALRAASYFISHAVVVNIAPWKIWGAERLSSAAAIREYMGYLGPALGKMVSANLTTLQMRSIIVLPTIIAWAAVGGDGEVSLDGIAIALSFTEAIWQVAMVVVHRKHAEYYRIPPTQRRVVGDASLSAVLMLVLSVCWFLPFLLDLQIITGKITYRDVITCSLVIAAIIPVIHMRYYWWLSHRTALAISIDVTIVCIQGAIFAVLGSLMSIAIATLIGSTLYLCTLALLRNAPCPPDPVGEPLTQ